MRKLEQSFTVTFNYPIYFTNGLFKSDNIVLAEAVRSGALCGRKLLFVVEEEVLNAHPGLKGTIEDYALKHFSDYDICGGIMVMPGGEQIKNAEKPVKDILENVHCHGIDRQSFIIAVGGGALLDMVGYAASIAHRGVRHIRIPTTVLSQNDSGVGVKNSINAFDKKNFLGSFTPPYAVINDYDFLTTLCDRDWLAGISEAIKVALIKDAGFFDFIRANAEALKNRASAPMQELVYKCAEMHMNHIGKSGDPFERGSSRPLDFGHWAAHKLEQLTNYSLRHGEAVAIGIALDVTYSFLSGKIKKTEWKQIIDLIHQLGFKLYVPEMSLLDKTGKYVLISGLTEFREHLGGALTIMLLEEIGKGVEVNHINHNLVIKSIGFLKKYSTGEEPALIFDFPEGEFQE